MSRENTTNWSTELYPILLGFRTTIKDDLKQSSAELVYGENLRVLGEFLVPQPSNKILDPTNVVDQLRLGLRNVQATPTRKSNIKQFVPKQLSESDFVFIRVEGIRSSLQSPYQGPFKVITRHEKFFDIDINGKSKNISIDRLKPAFISQDSSILTRSSPHLQKKVTFAVAN